MIKDKLRFHKLLPQFIEKWTHGKEFHFWVQAFRISDYTPGVSDPKNHLGYLKQKDYRTKEPRHPETKDWEAHFSQKPKQNPKFIFGAMSIPGNFKGNVDKWICYDADNEEEFKVVQDKIRPWLNKHGIEHVVEYSQLNRCHCFIFLDSVPHHIAKRLVAKIAKECGTIGEVYPHGARRTSGVRVIGGWHFWTGCANPVEKDGIDYTDSLDIMQLVIDCKPLSTQWIVDNTDPIPDEEKKERKLKKEWRYLPRTDLECPVSDMGDMAEVTLTQCQALNSLFQDIKGYKEDPENSVFNIQEAGIPYHLTGLAGSGLAVFSDIIHEHRKGRDVWDDLSKEFRDRSSESHHWPGDKEYVEMKDNPHKLIWTCKTYNDSFNRCKGCKFQNQPGFTNPRQLFFSKPFQINKVEDVEIVTLDHIRNVTLPQACKEVKDLIVSGNSGTIAVKCPQRSGKSYATDDLIAELVTKYGVVCVLALPTARLAMEHTNRLRSKGIAVASLYSHDKIFSEDNPHNLTFKCPYYDNIRYYSQLQVPSSYYKKKYCNGCPVKDKCPYPDQYTKAQDPNIKVVVMQHAHFKAIASMRQILNREIDFMAIDEEFMSDLISSYVPVESEYEILKSFGADWSTTLGEWMEKGGYPIGRVNAPVEDLEALKDLFESNGLAFERLRVFIEAYNSEEYMNPRSGLKLFFPPPGIRVKLLTNATLPEKKTKIVLNEPNLTVLGKNQVIDVRDYHPDNKVISVIDSSASKSSLLKDERFYENLNIVGHRCMHEWKDDKVLITTYMSRLGPKGAAWSIDNPIQASIDHLRDAFPSLDVGDKDSDARIVVAGMAVGTNAFSHFTAQAIMASVHLSGSDILKDAYHTKIIMNHYNRVDGRPEIKNPYPEEAFNPDMSPGVDVVWVPLRKTTVYGVIECPDIMVPIPSDPIERMATQLAIGTSQQTWRIAYEPGMPKRKEVLDFTIYWKQGQAYTDLVTYGELIAKLE